MYAYDITRSLHIFSLVSHYKISCVPFFRFCTDYLTLITILPLIKNVPSKPTDKPYRLKLMENLLTDGERLTRTDSFEPNGKKRVRHELDELSLDSPDVKRLRDDLFDDLGLDPVVQDLDSVMKSFEDELSTTTVQGSGETQPDLGYLFEASDDELGLPPPPPPLPTLCTEETVTELVRVSSDSSEVGELCGFEDHVTDFGTCDLGDELFEYSDVCLDSGDLYSWRPEFLPAE